MNGTLKIDNWILASIIKQVLVGWHTVVSQKLGKSICATSVHQVSQEFNIFWSELILVLQVYIDKVPKKRASKKNIYIHFNCKYLDKYYEFIWCFPNFVQDSVRAVEKEKKFLIGPKEDFFKVFQLKKKS